MSTLFRHGRIFDGRSADLLEDVEVLVEGSRIAEVSDVPIRSATAEVVDLRGRTLMPGLIDAHFHAIAASPDLGAVEHMPPSLIAQHARANLEATLQRGFTTVRDAAGADYGLFRAIEAGLIAGPRLFYSGHALSQTGGHGDFRSYESGPAICSCGLGARHFSTVADGVPEVRRAAREELRRGATQIKIMGSGGVSSPSDPISNLQYSEEEIRAAVWEAHSWGTYVMAHVYTPEAIRRCVEYGVRSVEHANLIDAGTAAFAAERGAFVVPTLATYESLGRRGASLGLPRVSLDKLGTVSDAGVASLELLRECRGEDRLRHRPARRHARGPTDRVRDPGPGAPERRDSSPGHQRERGAARALGRDRNGDRPALSRTSSSSTATRWRTSVSCRARASASTWS